MKKYFTNLHIENSMFIATVFDANTNQEIYKTKPYNAQSKATEDVNKFLTNQKTTQNSPSIPEAFINSTVHKPVLGVPSKKCCGRG